MTHLGLINNYGYFLDLRYVFVNKIIVYVCLIVKLKLHIKFYSISLKSRDSFNYQPFYSLNQQQTFQSPVSRTLVMIREKIKAVQPKIRGSTCYNNREYNLGDTVFVRRT